MSEEIIKFSILILGVLLSVNAYYFKDIVKSLQEIKIELTKLATKHDINSDLVQKHEREIDEMRERLHSLEGGQLQIMEHIKGSD